MVHCFTYETVRSSKQATATDLKGRKRQVSDAIWETFDGLFKSLHRHGRKVEDLERRVVELERRLQERALHTPHAAEAVERVTHMPAEKAA